MAHRLRAKVQSAAIKNIYQELSTQKALLVIDHKQKVLPVVYMKWQVEYFRKRGMTYLVLYWSDVLKEMARLALNAYSWTVYS
jgi:hypothetical protein